jgi:hypothetical protein
MCGWEYVSKETFKRNNSKWLRKDEYKMRDVKNF